MFPKPGVPGGCAHPQRVSAPCWSTWPASQQRRGPQRVLHPAGQRRGALFLLCLPALCEEVAGKLCGNGWRGGHPRLPPVLPPSFPTLIMDADGFIVNTDAELEQGVLSAIAEGRCKHGTGCRATTLYPNGSVILFPMPPDPPHKCVRWLETQPPGSCEI
jgi:hypothetical protein